MNALLFILLALVWLAIGSFSFIFWITKDYDVKVSDLIVIVFASIGGPISFLMGWLAFRLSGNSSDSDTDKVLFKKRK